MLLTKEQSDARLNSPDNLMNSVRVENSKIKSISNFNNSPQDVLEIVPTNRGGHANKGKERVNYTTEEQALIASTAITTNDNQGTAKAFGVSDSTISHWKQGRIGPADPDVKYSREKPELRNAIEQRLGIVRDVALEKLIESLNLIDTKQLESTTAVQKSVIASNLSKVVERTQSRDVNINKSNVIIYAPRQRDLDTFEIIES